MTVGYPCSSPGCSNAAAWAVLSEAERVGDPSEWGVWNYVGALLVTATATLPRTLRSRRRSTTG
jgi:hypothetical protein